MSLTLSLDFQYKTSMEKLWSALTDANKLTKWMVNVHTGQAMENDFKPVIGHHFQFRTQPTEYWDGIVSGEVLIVEEPHRLSYTWCSGERSTRSPGRCRIQRTERLTFILNKPESQMLKHWVEPSMAGAIGAASLKRYWSNNRIPSKNGSQFHWLP